jgi:hypothetical protein
MKLLGMKPFVLKHAKFLHIEPIVHPPQFNSVEKKACFL